MSRGIWGLGDVVVGGWTEIIRVLGDSGDVGILGILCIAGFRGIGGSWGVGDDGRLCGLE